MPRCCVLFCLLLSSLLSAVASAVPAFAQGVTAAEYEACQARDEDAFRQAIETITVRVLTEELNSVDYEAAVAIEWRRLGLDAIIDARVDKAVAEVRDSASWGELIRSLGSQEKAQELATAVAEKVYRSAEMREAIEALATSVGTETGKRIELASQDAAGPVLKCLKTFLGPRYGSAVATAVTGDAGRDFAFDANKGSAEIGAGAVLKQSGEGITGAAILVLRRQLANMAQRLGQRLAGSVLSRLVSVAAGGVGVVLIAKDIWDLRHGVLPIIADEMKSKESKEKVRQELARSLAEEIKTNIRDIGAHAADRVVEVWREFRRAHAKAIELAERDEGFRRFLDGIEPSKFARLDEVLSLLLASEGESGILRRTADGSLATAVNQLPEPGMAIARETGSVATALAWWAVAGSRIDKVHENEIHRVAKPESFSQASLERVLGLGDRLPVGRLAAADRSARDVLLELDQPRLKALASHLDTRELESLAVYLTGLDKEPRERVLEAVAASPASLKAIASRRVRNAIIGSADQAAAIEMMLRPAGSSFPAIESDFRAVWNGRVSPLLLWEKHPAVLIAAAVLLLFLMLWLKRLLFPARRQPPPAPRSA